MSFRVTQKTLESLEWPEVARRLREECRMPQQEIGNSFAEFAEGLTEVKSRLAETSEARALLDGDLVAPLGGVVELQAAFRHAGKGGTLTAQQLLEVRSTLVALHETKRFLEGNAEHAPQLAAQASILSDRRALERDIDGSIDPGGEVRDEATTELAAARRESNQLAGDLQRRLARYLKDPDVSASLSDDFYTVRNDRYVLPVRADAKGAVRGIVHDASRSGTTLFIEPEAVVELNNKLKETELAVAREVFRVLRDLTARVAEEAPTLRADIELLARIDLAFARGHLSQQMQAVEPRVERDGVFRLAQLRHPLLDPDEAVANDLQLGADWHVLVISGPNAGGKTVALKSLGLAALFVRAGLHVPADRGAQVALVDDVLADIGDGQDLRESLSTFSAHMVNLANIVGTAARNTLALLDEVGVGTDPGEGATLAQAVLEALADAGTRVVATTHYNLLKEMAAVDPRFCNASVGFDPETLAPTYRLHLGEPGPSSATAVAARMGMPPVVLERANALQSREDRRLDRMLSELAASRAALEAEQREVEAARLASENVRDEYRAKLERLQERRDKLFVSMREDLDAAFKEAHGEVASVIRDLQRQGTAQDAARARSKLEDLQHKAREAETLAGVHHAEGPRPDAVDWRHAKPGDPIGIPGGGTGVLSSLPDPKGRVRVKTGSATIVVLSDRLTAISKPAAKPEHDRVHFEATAGAETHRGGGTLHCDLRGLRVEEAREKVVEALDRALADDRAAVEFIHGIGTGALRQTVREELAASTYVTDVRSGDPNHGGDGVTTAIFDRR